MEGKYCSTMEIRLLLAAQVIHSYHKIQLLSFLASISMKHEQLLYVCMWTQLITELSIRSVLLRDIWLHWNCCIHYIYVCKAYARICISFANSYSCINLSMYVRTHMKQSMYEVRTILLLHCGHLRV